MLIELKSKNGKKLKLGGKICKEDITLVPKLKDLTITENKTYTPPEGYVGFNKIIANVPTGGGSIPDGYIKPSGTKSITENGTYPVAEFASVDVQVSGGGSGSAECDKQHINIVDELPAVGVDGAVYGVPALVDIVIVMMNTAFSMSDGDVEISGIITTSENLSSIEGVQGMICYVSDIPEIYGYESGEWVTFSSQLDMPFLGEIASIGEADTSTDGYYAVIGHTLYKYTSGQFKQLFTRGGVILNSNGDGTCRVDGVQANYDIDLVIPSVSPDGEPVTQIDYAAFKEKVFASITIPNTVKRIENQSFQNVFCKTINIPDSVETIGGRAFQYSTIDTITIPNSVTSIEGYAFKGSSIGSIIIPDSVTDMAGSVFCQCGNLYSVTLSNNITTLETDMFFSCTSLECVTLGNSISVIERMAFRQCRGLEIITLPASLTKMESSVFSGCYSLKTIKFSGTVEQWNAIELADGWKGSAPATTVTCSDGEVTL